MLRTPAEQAAVIELAQSEEREDVPPSEELALLQARAVQMWADGELPPEGVLFADGDGAVARATADYGVKHRGARPLVDVRGSDVTLAAPDVDGVRRRAYA